MPKCTNTALLALAFPWLFFTSNAIWTSTTSITLQLRTYYGISSSVVSELPNLSFSVIYILFGLFSSWVTNCLNIYRTLIVSALLLVFGDCCRVLSSYGFGWLMAGNILVSFAQPLVFANMSQVAALTVQKTRQGQYLGIVSLIGSIGTAWGFAVSSLLIKTPDEYGIWFPRIELLYLVIDIAVLVMLLAGYRQWLEASQKKKSRRRRKKVVKATDIELGLNQSTQHPETVGSCCFIICNWKQHPNVATAIALVIAAVLNGASNAITIVLQQIQASEGYDDATVLIAGLLYLVPCIPSPWLFGIWMDTSQHASRVSAFLFILTAALQIAVLKIGSASLNGFYIAITLYGVSTNALSTAFLASAVKWKPNASPVVVNTIYSWLNTLVTLGLTLLFEVLSVQQSTNVFFVEAALCGIASLVLPFLIR